MGPDLLAPEISSPWLRELVRVRGGSHFQLSGYVAVSAGIRPALDDFVPLSHFESFTEFVGASGLQLRTDAMFQRVLNEAEIPSMAFSPTTKAIGRRWRAGEEAPRNSEVHVIVARSAVDADRAWAAGWYPIAIGKRILPKPKIDHQRFGAALGYPRCCVIAFERYNNWGRFDHISEVARRSQRFVSLANSFWKHTGYMLNFHIPCRFDCKASVRLGEKTLSAICDVDPAYASAIWAAIIAPVLHVSERMSFAFEGACVSKQGDLNYSGVYDVLGSSTGKDSRHEYFLKALSNGDGLTICGSTVRIKSPFGEKELRSQFHEGAVEIPQLFLFD